MHCGILALPSACANLKLTSCEMTGKSAHLLTSHCNVNYAVDEENITIA